MLLVILLTIFTAIVGGLNPNIHHIRSDFRKYMRGWLKRILIALIPAYIQFYLFMPAMVGPFYGMGKIMFQFWAINFFLTWGENFKKDPEKTRGIVRRNFPKGAIFAGLFALCLGGVSAYSAAMFNAPYYATVIGTVKEMPASELITLRPEQFRAVSRDYADWLGRRALTDALSSSFKLGTWTLQRVRGKAMWVAPLEFNLGRNYFFEDATPGYMTVATDDPKAKGQLVREINGKPLLMRVLPTSWSFNNLSRAIYLNGFANYRLGTPRFELDDDGQPFWVAALTRPSLGWSCDKLERVLLVDACNGEISSYSPEDCPKWVDQIYPTELLASYIEWWGYYHKGYLGTLAQSSGLRSLARTLSLWWSADGTPYLSGVITGRSGSGPAMVGIIRANARTGEVAFSSKIGNDEDAFASAAHAKFANMLGWHLTEALIYNVDGQLVWGGPIDSNSSIYQRMAFSPIGSTSAIVVDSIEEAIAGLRQANIGESSDTQLLEQTLTVERIEVMVHQGESVVQLTTLETPNIIYSAISSSFTGLALTRPGDTITIKVAPAERGIVQLVGFKNAKVLTQSK